MRRRWQEGVLDLLVQVRLDVVRLSRCAAGSASECCFGEGRAHARKEKGKEGKERKGREKRRHLHPPNLECPAVVPLEAQAER